MRCWSRLSLLLLESMSLLKLAYAHHLGMKCSQDRSRDVADFAAVPPSLRSPDVSSQSPAFERFSSALQSKLHGPFLAGAPLPYVAVALAFGLLPVERLVCALSHASAQVCVELLFHPAVELAHC